MRGWLSRPAAFRGRANANAASRQIAVKMGLVEANDAVTAGERAHGHRAPTAWTRWRTTRARRASRSNPGEGFSSSPSQFQFDLLMKNKIIDEGYLEGCYPRHAVSGIVGERLSRVHARLTGRAWMNSRRPRCSSARSIMDDEARFLEARHSRQLRQPGLRGLIGIAWFPISQVHGNRGWA